MVTLNSSVKIVVVQFSFTNPNVIPSGIRSLERESVEASIGRKAVITGRMVITPVERCSLGDIALDLMARGYIMVDALYQQRVDHKNGGRGTYHTVRFVFAPIEQADPSEEFVAAREGIHNNLREMCSDALWRVRAFLNPYYNDVTEVEGEFAVSINLESRIPVKNPDDSPMLQWKKDSQGRRVGDTAVPIQPACRLVISGDQIELAPS